MISGQLNSGYDYFVIMFNDRKKMICKRQKSMGNNFCFSNDSVT